MSVKVNKCRTHSLSLPSSQTNFLWNELVGSNFGKKNGSLAEDEDFENCSVAGRLKIRSATMRDLLGTWSHATSFLLKPEK